MVQTHDVMIDGAGYMIVPGSYRYANQGAAVAAVRTGVPSFGQPLGREATHPTVIDRDAVRWGTVGMMPIPAGIGDEGGRLILAPAESRKSSALGSNFDTNSHIIIYGGSVYISVVSSLFRVALASGNYSALTFIGNAPGTITSMAVIGGLLYMACASPATTLCNYAGSGALANTPAATAQVIWQYAGGIWRSKLNAVNGLWDKISGSFDGGATWTDWELDSAIKAVVPWHGRATAGGVMLIATQNMIWELTGQWTGSPVAFSGTVSVLYSGAGGGNTDDFSYLVAYDGFVYTWYAGSVARWNGTRLQTMPGAPRGNVYGMGTAGGYLVVSVADAPNFEWSLWLYDGVAWALMDRTGAVALGSNCAGTGGIVGDGTLMSLNQFGTTLSLYALPMAEFTTNPRASGQVWAGPLDAGQGDAVKTWTQLSVGWSTALYPWGGAAPANPGGNLLIEYSVDDGVNWIAAGTTVIAAAARQGLAVQAVNVEAQRLMVRATWTPTSAYAGLQIDGIWASGWRIGDVPKMESWDVTVKITDKLVKRDGSIDARSGETQLQALRALAQAGRTFTFQDIDYDLNARNVTARITELKEKERKGDGTHFLESQVALTIVAVA